MNWPSAHRGRAVGRLLTERAAERRACNASLGLTTRRNVKDDPIMATQKATTTRRSRDPSRPVRRNARTAALLQARGYAPSRNGIIDSAADHGLPASER